MLKNCCCVKQQQQLTHYYATCIHSIHYLLKKASAFLLHFCNVYTTLLRTKIVRVIVNYNTITH